MHEDDVRVQSRNRLEQARAEDRAAAVKTDERNAHYLHACRLLEYQVLLRNVVLSEESSEEGRHLFELCRDDCDFMPVNLLQAGQQIYLIAGIRMKKIL